VDRAVAGPPQLAAIALGSNLGDRRAAIAFAIDRLSRILSDVTVSDLVETEPETIDGGIDLSQPLYLNAVITGWTSLAAGDLLSTLLSIEAEYGRERPYSGAPRTLDLDLVLLADQVVDEPGLQVPHPRFRARFFVLGPLTQIAPDMRDPVTGLSASELLRALMRDESR
jgi:2-amino-4-hydroxy-6-hydroxymethyldihydropteridine diphosphokinase